MCRASRSPSVPSVTSRALLRPPPVDVAIAAAFVAFAVAEGLAGPGDQPWWRAVAGGFAAALLAWRRQAPILVAALVVLVNVLTDPEAQFSTLLSLVLVCFTVGYETRPPRSYAGLAIVLVPFIGVSIVDGFEPSDLAAAMVFFAGPWTVGTVTRDRATRAEEAVARADRLEAEREQEAARIAQQERTRIARELHDIVSHSISVVTIQTQAVRRRLGPDHAREAEDLAAVEATAREALAEMRRLFGVLRTDGESASLAPQPGLSELGRLVEQASTGDLAATLTVEGDPVDLSPGLDLAAYRIAQEGLTNALRHSGARHATVTLRWSPTRLDVEVEDDGRGLHDGTCERRARARRHPRTRGPVRRHGAARARAVRRHPAGRHPPVEGQRVTRIVVCDDQGMVRAGFKSLLEAEPDLEVVGEASNGQEAIDIVTLLQPDVTLMDIRMPVLDGLAATRHLVEAGVPTSVLVLTTFDLDEYVFEALRAGASGFLLKDAPAEELAAAIRVVAAGDSLLAPGVTRRVIDAFVRRADPSTRPARLAARPAHAPRARGPGPPGARPLEPRHRPAAVRLRGHDQDARQQRADQAGAARPRAGGDLRLRERRGRARRG